MKYLKKFNESNSDKVEEIKKFCEDNLAYLIDAGFSLKYADYSSDDNRDLLNIDYQSIGLNVFLVRNSTNVFTNHFSAFNWDEVVNDFVPFLQMLDDKYGLIKLKPTSSRDKYSKKCSIMFHDNFTYRYTLDDLINDRTDGISDKKLEDIEFSVKI